MAGVMKEQRRIKVDGFEDSDVNLIVAVIQQKDGRIGMAVQGVEPTLQNLVDVRQLLYCLVQELDIKFPQIVQDSLKEKT